MKKVTIVRDKATAGPLGTFGRLSTGMFECDTLERAPDGDHPCIPAGTYKVVWKTKADHPVHGPCYEVVGVKGRTAILVHPANWADQLLGCIALGRSVDDVVRPDGSKMKGITSSKDAVHGFENDLDEQDFQLTISWT